MTRIIDSRRRSPILAAATVVFAAAIALGAGTASARDDRHWDHHPHPVWGGGYYHAPPVVYAAPYYAPPPIVYGPGIGLSINIR
jgi:hypothetical protein